SQFHVVLGRHEKALDDFSGLVYVKRVTEGVLDDRGLDRLELNAAFDLKARTTTDLQICVVSKGQVLCPVALGVHQPVVFAVQALCTQAVQGEGCCQAEWKLAVRIQQ